MTSAISISRANTSCRVTPVVVPSDIDAVIAVLAGIDRGEAYTGDGVHINSRFLDGLDVAAAKREAIARLEKLGIGPGTRSSGACAIGACRASAIGAARSR